MVLALDGNASFHTSTGGGTAASGTASITTVNANDVIVVVITNFSGGGQTITGVTDNGSAGLTFTKRASGLGEFDTELWYAISPSALTAESIKVTLSSATYLAFTVFGVSGANTVTPFDPNVSLPAVGAFGTSTANPSVTASTTNANDFIIAIGTIYHNTVVTSSWSGFTEIGSILTYGPVPATTNGGQLDVGYEVVSSAQSSVTFNPVTWSSAVYSVLAIDAIQEAAGVPTLGSYVYTPMQPPRLYGVIQESSALAPINPPVVGSYVYEPMQRVSYPVLDLTVQPPLPVVPPVMGSWVYEPMQTVPTRFPPPGPQTPLFATLPPAVPVMGTYVYEPMQRTELRIIYLNVPAPFQPTKVVKHGSTLLVLGAG